MSSLVPCALPVMRTAQFAVRSERSPPAPRARHRVCVARGVAVR